MKRRYRITFEVSRVVVLDDANDDCQFDDALENIAQEIANEVQEEVENDNVADLCFTRPYPTKRKRVRK